MEIKLSYLIYLLLKQDNYQLPIHLFLLSNPLLSEKIEVLSSCDDGNLNNSFTSFAVSIN